MEPWWDIQITAGAPTFSWVSLQHNQTMQTHRGPRVAIGLLKTADYNVPKSPLKFFNGQVQDNAFTQLVLMQFL